MTEIGPSSNGVPPLVVQALQGMKVIDRGKLELWELEELEEVIGESVDLNLTVAHPSIKFRRGLLWIWLRRTHPTLVYDDFRRVNLDLLNRTLGEVEEEIPDPTGTTPNGGDTSSTSPASGSSAPTPSSTASGA
jgi:hypothetical protein